ncbi:MAG: UbiX family flavin prenyltransferase [Myxococcota bacterium]
MKLVLGVTGATGAAYAARALVFFRQHREIHVDLVFTKNGRLVWQHEVGEIPTDFPLWGAGDMTAPFASGSARYDGMLILPCSAGTMARVATGVSFDLVGRAADVMLKERRPLVVVLRETPLSLIQLRNAQTLVEAGAYVMPASPSFYGRPTTVEQVLDTVVARALDRLGVPNELVTRWSGLPGSQP